MDRWTNGLASDGGCTARSWTSTPRGVSKVVLLTDSDSILSPLGIFKHCLFFFSFFFLRLDDRVRLRERNVRFVVICCKVDFAPFYFFFLCSVILYLTLACPVGEDQLTVDFFFLIICWVCVGFSFFFLV